MECHDPSEINSHNFSFHVQKAININLLDLSKKRKLQAECFGLPSSKHFCITQVLAPKENSISEENPEYEGINMQIIEEKSAGISSEGGSEPESAKDSNSVSEDPDPVMSVNAETKLNLNPEYVKGCKYDWPSTSSFHFVGNKLRNTLQSFDNRTLSARGKEPAIEGGDFDSLFLENELDHIPKDLEEQLNYLESICSGYGLEQCTDEEIQDLLFTNDTNGNDYVLSSGRWNVNEENQVCARKPTIDQEFEQYFSALML
ncbi:hypothetical protein RJ641_028353 [Dillenia turbinata]|uniref:Protein FAR-RED-ELONGATED HYPOCOTYL 1-LIKE-like n=1 Tax=Dillenia turbinata TaxID=194707 RepID=A0AAN8ZM81_9MAGN